MRKVGALWAVLALGIHLWMVVVLLPSIQVSALDAHRVATMFPLGLLVTGMGATRFRDRAASLRLAARPLLLFLFPSSLALPVLLTNSLGALETIGTLGLLVNAFSFLAYLGAALLWLGPHDLRPTEQRTQALGIELSQEARARRRFSFRLQGIAALVSANLFLAAFALPAARTRLERSQGPLATPASVAIAGVCLVLAVGILLGYVAPALARPSALAPLPQAKARRGIMILLLSLAAVAAALGVILRTGAW